MGEEGDMSVRWFHLHCANPKCEPEEVGGFDSLKVADQEEMKKVFAMPKGKRKAMASSTASPSVKAPEAKKFKVGDLKAELEKRGLDASGKKAELVVRLQEKFNAEAEEETKALENHPDKLKFDEYVAEFTAMSNGALKEICKANEAKVSGSKAELTQRLADIKMWGGIPKCTACGGGTPTVVYLKPWGHGGQGQWVCKGYFDDDQWQPCNNRPATVERVPFKEA